MPNAAQQKVFQADSLAQERRDLEERYDELAKEIVKYVREHGSRSRKAPGKLVVTGAEFELALTDALLRSFRSPKALARFLGACPKKFLKRVIRRRVQFTLLPQAEKYLVQHTSAKVLKLYQAAVRVKKSKPRLSVRELKPKRSPAVAKRAV
jgi:hypothetical protein